MDDNQTVDDDLQRAIDNITNTTAKDPVFSDPVASPTEDFTSPTNPFPENVEPIQPTAESPIAPIETVNTPEPINPPVDQFEPIPAPTFEETKIEEESITEEPLSEPAPEEPVTDSSTTQPIQDDSTTQPIQDNLTVDNVDSIKNDIEQIKEKALRDLVPVLDKINMDPARKYKIYRDMFEKLNDKSIIKSAYEAAREIEDETVRAESLLELVDFIDRL